MTPDQPPPAAYETPAQLLARARVLLGMADEALQAGLLGPDDQAWARVHKEDAWGYTPYDRAKVLAAVATCAARVAHAMSGAEHVAYAMQIGAQAELRQRRWDEILDRAAADEDDESFRCADCGQEFDTANQLAGHHVAEHGLRPTGAQEAAGGG